MYLYLPFLFLAFFSSALWAAPVNINTADARAISAALDGIGMKKAQAIVDYRKAHGPFRTLEALTGVKGIGRRMIDNNRADIRLKE